MIRCIRHTKNSAIRIKMEPRYLFALARFSDPGVAGVVVVAVVP